MTFVSSFLTNKFAKLDLSKTFDELDFQIFIFLYSVKTIKLVLSYKLKRNNAIISVGKIVPFPRDSWQT